MAETIIIALQAIETLDELCENAICSQKKYDNNDKEVLVGRLSEQDFRRYGLGRMFDYFGSVYRAVENAYPSIFRPEEFDIKPPASAVQIKWGALSRL